MRRPENTLMPNRLALEPSPYLLQHANNPVDWFPWGNEALAKAKLELVVRDEDADKVC